MNFEIQRKVQCNFKIYMFKWSTVQYSEIVCREEWKLLVTHFLFFTFSDVSILYPRTEFLTGLTNTNY